MDVGELVHIVKTVGEELVKIPAMVTKVYENTHGQVVADLHELESTIHGVVVAENNPPEAVPAGGPVVTTNADAPPEAAIPSEAGAATSNDGSTPPTAPPASAQLTQEESDYAKLSDADKAAFAEWQASQSQAAMQTQTSAASGEPQQ